MKSETDVDSSKTSQENDPTASGHGDLEDPKVEAPGTAKKDRSGLKISSIIMGKKEAAQLREKYDDDGDNYISPQELGRLASDIAMSEREKKFLWRAIYFLTGVTILLIGSMFGVTWLAVSLNQKLDADDSTDQLVSEKTGNALSTLSHSPTLNLEVNWDLVSNVRRRQLEGGDEIEMAEDVNRILASAPTFTIPASQCHDAWDTCNSGNCGAGTIFLSMHYEGDMMIAVTNISTLTRTQETGGGPPRYIYRYFELSFNVEGGENKYELRCPHKDNGDCEGWQVTNTARRDLKDL